MNKGKYICNTLKAIRQEIADANDIDYKPAECNHEGDCEGTCPRCENEMRWLERQLRLRQQLGKAVAIAGMSVAMGIMSSSCNVFQPSGHMERQPVDTTQVAHPAHPSAPVQQTPAK